MNKLLQLEIETNRPMVFGDLIKLITEYLEKVDGVESYEVIFE